MNPEDFTLRNLVMLEKHVHNKTISEEVAHTQIQLLAYIRILI